MEILIYILAYGIAFAIGVAILAGSLFLVEESRASSFKEIGVAGTLARCAGIVLITTLLRIIPFPFGFLLSLVVWFVGIMFLFQKTFVQTLILWLVNVVLSCGVIGALDHVLSRALRA
ncbi:MAG TPA: hypothetical protein VKD71_04820 [Gemmataceae bacterium]|nr:hypothetical protein [Gemmataceae bacterium]